MVKETNKNLKTVNTEQTEIQLVWLSEQDTQYFAERLAKQLSLLAEPVNLFIELHGDMAYMSAHGLKRARPAELVPGTVSVLTARMDYLPRSRSQSSPSKANSDWTNVELQRLQHTNEAIISIYARGRDYHKVMRSRLQKLSERIALHINPLGYRVFTDSAPVLDAELAQRCGQGWRG